MRGCLASTGWSNETGVNGDSHQTTCSPWNTDSYPLRHYHSDLNSKLIVCFPPEGSVQQGTHTNAVGFFTCKLALLNFFGISNTTSTAWRLNPTLGRCVIFWLFERVVDLSSRILSCSTEFYLDFTQQTDRKPFSSQWSLLTSVPFLSLVGWKELIWLTFFPPSLSPLTVRGLSG